MTHRTAFKTACIKYARLNQIPIPDGVNTSDTYGQAARELTKKIQRRAKIKQTGNIDPDTLLVVGRYLPGATVGERAVWSMRCMIGPLEVWGDNSGPAVEAIQRIGVNDFGPGRWPWCAATTSWALRCAGWTSWGAFAKTGHGEAGVITWKNAAIAQRYGLRVKPWRRGVTGDLLVFGSDAHHIGFLDSRVNPITGDCYGIEGNTASPRSGKQGLFRKSRNAREPQLVISVR